MNTITNSSHKINNHIIIRMQLQNKNHSPLHTITYPTKYRTSRSLYQQKLHLSSKNNTKQSTSYLFMNKKKYSYQSVLHTQRQYIKKPLIIKRQQSNRDMEDNKNLCFSSNKQETIHSRKSPFFSTRKQYNKGSQVLNQEESKRLKDHIKKNILAGTNFISISHRRDNFQRLLQKSMQNRQYTAKIKYRKLDLQQHKKSQTATRKVRKIIKISEEKDTLQFTSYSPWPPSFNKHEDQEIVSFHDNYQITQ